MKERKKKERNRDEERKRKECTVRKRDEKGINVKQKRGKKQ